MSLVLHADAVPLRVDAHGDVRVGSTRVLLDLLIRAFNDGATPETLVQSYSTLQLADVYAVIGYYLRHREEVDEYVRKRQEEGEQLRQKIEAQQGDLSDIRARLLARQAKLSASHAASA